MIKFAIILMVFCAIFLVWRITKTRAMRREVQMLKAYRESMEMIYTGMEERLGLVRKYRHDLKNHIILLEELADKRTDIHGLDDFVEHQRDVFDKLKEHRFVKDEILDTLLSIKYQECQDKEIPCEIVVMDELYDGIDSTDLITLLMNLFDNAIEENEKIPAREERGIWIRMQYEGDEIHIELHNRIRKGRKITFRTQKKEGIHGLGMKIIEEVIQIYDGTRTTKVDDQEHVLKDLIILKVA